MTWFNHKQPIELRGNIADSNCVIDSIGHVQTVIGPDTPDWGELQGQLSVAFYRCFVAHGNLEDLEAARAAAQTAVEWAQPEHPKRAVLYHNRGLIHEARFLALGQIADLDSAIDDYRISLHDLPSEARVWACFRVDLAGALTRRFTVLKQIHDIDEAIRMFQEALPAVAKRKPERATIQNNITTIRPHLQLAGARAVGQRHQIANAPSK